MEGSDTCWEYWSVISLKQVWSHQKHRPTISQHLIPPSTLFSSLRRCKVEHDADRHWIINHARASRFSTKLPFLPPFWSNHDGCGERRSVLGKSGIHRPGDRSDWGFPEQWKHRCIKKFCWERRKERTKERFPENSDVIGFPKGIAKIDAPPTTTTQEPNLVRACSLARLSVCSYKLN